MPGAVVVGTQWGDEGKGRFTDYLAKEASLCVRYQGGHNAGHTLVVDGEVFKLQLVPSGVLYPWVVPVIGNGVVVDPRVLLTELEMLQSRSIDTRPLRLSGNAHLIMPYHQELDRLNERYPACPLTAPMIWGRVRPISLSSRSLIMSSWEIAACSMRQVR